MDAEAYMKLAIEEAKKGEGFTNPNPMVGAVIVKDGRIISKDHHRKYGGYHAERNAILNCREDMHGAELYVTLEPCCHYGKTPPCTEIIIESGIKKVYIGIMDKNSLVAGKGAAILREHGIEVVEGICEKECQELNKIFFHYIQTKTPYVVMKYAMTADGKIATHTGDSKWITGEMARERVQRSRHKYMGIMAGVNTVLMDDPKLTCRIEGMKSPIRIICDTHLRTPLSAQVVQTASEVPTIIATIIEEEEKKKPYTDLGCQVWTVPADKTHIDLKALMKKAGEAGIDSILLEGGGTLNYSALKSGIVQDVEMYIAPKIFGGELAKTPVEGQGIAKAADAFELKNPQIEQIGPDILVTWEVEQCLQES